MLLVYLTPEESANPAILQQITDALRNAQGAELGALTCGHHIHPDDNPSTGVCAEEKVALNFSCNNEVHTFNVPTIAVEPPLSSLFSVTAEAQAINPQAPVVPVPPVPSTAVAAPLPTALAAPTPGPVPVPPVVPPPAPSPAAVVPVPTAPVTTPNPAGGVQVDGANLPWDARIHSSPPKINDSDKMWRKKRGVDPQLVIQVEAQLRQVMSAPTAAAPVAPPVPPVPTTPSTPAPPATTAGTAYPSDFPTFITAYTRAIARGDLVEASALEVIRAFDVPAVGLLVQRADLIPAISQALSLKV